MKGCCFPCATPESVVNNPEQKPTFPEKDVECTDVNSEPE